MMMSVASGAMRLRISSVILPIPGPYSTMTLARSHSTAASMSLMRNGEQGTTAPSMVGCRNKLRVKRAMGESGRDRARWLFRLGIYGEPLLAEIFSVASTQQPARPAHVAYRLGSVEAK